MIGNDHWRQIAATARPEDVREAILTGYRDGKIFAPYVPLLKMPPLDHVLDFGCGLGRNIPYLCSVADPAGERDRGARRRDRGRAAAAARRVIEGTLSWLEHVWFVEGAEGQAAQIRSDTARPGADAAGGSALPVEGGNV